MNTEAESISSGIVEPRVDLERLLTQPNEKLVQARQGNGEARRKIENRDEKWQSALSLLAYFYSRA